jgi:hypothetical protein
MAERVRDGGRTTTEQAEQAEQVEREESRPAEPERRPTYKTLDERQGRLTEAEERFERGRRTIGCSWDRWCSTSPFMSNTGAAAMMLPIGSPPT